MIFCQSFRPTRNYFTRTIALGLMAVLPPWIGAQETIGPREDYAAVAAQLEEFITDEMQDKDIPAISISLVDDQEIVWAHGFGVADPDQNKPATAETMYRVGSVSKLFTDIGVMQLVEKGQLDLDAPVRTYLPDFHPANPFGKEITLRQLMSHRSGLVREPPVGHYFDNTAPSIADTVASLNETELVYSPETRTKYSNAGITVAGYVLESTQNRPFAQYLKAAVLEPMGLGKSAFAPDDAINRDLATGYMWSYDGRRFPAPPIQLGMAPAGSMYSTVNELGRFITVVFNEGRGPNGAVVQPETLEKMFAPQFAGGYGIGFSISRDGETVTYGHGGAIYGFATQLSFRRDEKIGVVVASNVDVTNTVTRRIARTALEMMSAKKNGRVLPPVHATQPVDPTLARLVQGSYANDSESIELVERNGELFLDQGHLRMRVRRSGSDFVTDGRIGYGDVVQVIDRDRIRVNGSDYIRQPQVKPEPAPERWMGLIGEYGWDHNVLFVYEKDGQLHCLIEWVEIDALKEISPDAFAFPEKTGLYHGERIVFTRDAVGRATQAKVAGMIFPRRKMESEDAETYRITPVKPMDELRAAALAVGPPGEKGEFREADLVELVTLDPTIKLDVRYAGTNNFMGAVLYKQPRAFMQRPAAEALVRVHRALKERGYGLLIHDAYRPWFVTKMFWDATPFDKKRFVADPRQGSRHNRGCAVDLTLYELATGEPVKMVALYDEMTPRSYPDYFGGTSLERWHRELLYDAMASEGFTVYEFEWWHFDYKDWKKYRIQNQSFEEILAKAGNSSSPSAEN